MATSAITQSSVELSHASTQITGVFPGYRPATTEPEEIASAEGAGTLLSLPQSALGGAKAIMTAIGMEASGALCLCGIWRLWHLLR